MYPSVSSPDVSYPVKQIPFVNCRLSGIGWTNNLPFSLYFALRMAASLICASSSSRCFLQTSVWASISCAIPPTIRRLITKYLQAIGLLSNKKRAFLSYFSSSTCLACCAAVTRLSVDLMTAFPAAWSLLVASVSPSAFTLQATKRWAVELATCFAAAISLSSLAKPVFRLMNFNFYRKNILVIFFFPAGI